VDPSQLLGEYLLKGWTMMGDACTFCNHGVPLMRSKAADQLICVMCGKDYLAVPLPAPSSAASPPLEDLPIENKPFSGMKRFYELFDQLPNLTPCLVASIAALNSPSTSIEEKLQHAALLNSIKSFYLNLT